ncbi:MAG: LemA family protein [Alphaproteobacteria bacterium]|nr:LemA family protein [Alphaproteobacteria bacterium]
MTLFLGLLAGVALLVLLWAIALYNTLVRRRALVEEGWSGIETQLKRRANLVPNLIETVKGYAAHERGTLEDLTAARTASLRAHTVEEQAEAQRTLGRALGSLMAVAEAYPDLKASQTFGQLQTELAEIEDQIQLSRRYYNGTVRDLNIMVDQFPSNIVAGRFGFRKATFFEIEDAAERSVPRVDFS